MADTPPPPDYGKDPFEDDLLVDQGGFRHLFLEGGILQPENRSKLWALILGVILLLAGAFYYFTDPEGGGAAFFADSEEFVEEDLPELPPLKPAGKADDDQKVSGLDPQVPASGRKEQKEEPPPVTPDLGYPEEVTPPPVPSTRASLESPQNNYYAPYDETREAPLFSWSGGPGNTVFWSRSANMRPVLFREYAGSKTSLRMRMRRFAPGTWYWQVRNGAGRSQIGVFKILAPVARKVVIRSPKDQSEVSGQDLVVAWDGDNKVSYYRVELSNNSWQSVKDRYASVATSLTIPSLSSGAQQLRVGAFSEVSGRWEYSETINLNVQ